MSGKSCIFVSSVQKEFAEERKAIKMFVTGDPLLRRFFDVFLFEDIPATDRRADDVYIEQIDRCTIYVGLFGNRYGAQGSDDVSPTEREFDHAMARSKPRLVFVKGMQDDNRHPRMNVLIRKAGDQLVRRRFVGIPDLNAMIYASLTEHLCRTGAIHTGPFDASACPEAALSDISEERIEWFLARARQERGYALGPGTQLHDALRHLNLLDHDRPSHAAILLFGARPQRFMYSEAHSLVPGIQRRSVSTG